MENLIGNYVNIRALHYNQLKSIGQIEDELVLITAPSFKNLILPYIKPGTKYIFARRNIDARYINRLLEIPPDAEVLVINDFITGVYELIHELRELDLQSMRLFPYDPGLTEDIYNLGVKPDPKKLALRQAFSDSELKKYIASYDIPKYSGKPFQYVITAGELDMVPKWIPHIIDLGQREISIMTVVEILYNLTGDMTYDRLVGSRYQKGIIRLNYQLQKQAIENQVLKERLSAVIANTNQGIIMVDSQNKVKLSNKLARELLNESDMQDRSLDQILAPEDMEQLSNSNFFRINDLDIYAERIPVPVQHDPDSFVLMLEPINKIQVIDEKYRHKIKSGNTAKYRFRNIIHKSKIMKELIIKAKAFAISDATILIMGESGTGKEIIAQAIHNVSPRQAAPFVAVNCSALTESLLESELFGYDEGAFTGAKRGGKKGLLELAHQGTLFLDEVGDAPISIQTRLLRVLQEKEVLRVGGDRPIPIDIRVIAATNKDLFKLVLAGKFREDLFYRLNVLLLKFPPLRERKEDILPLIDYFLDPNTWLKHAAFVKREDVLALLTQYNWPGNIRQLRNVIEFLASSPASETLLEDLKQLLNINEAQAKVIPAEKKTDYANSDLPAKMAGIIEKPAFPNSEYKLQCCELLKILYEAQNNCISRLSQRELLQITQDKKMSLSLQQIKSRLEHLKKYDLVNSQVGVGTWITEQGILYIKNAQQ
jgi:transcriptional regulator with PAS, ATPase and Fis domain